MTIQLGVISFIQELKIALSDKEGQNLQVCFPTKSAVKKRQVKRTRSVEKNPWRF